MVHILLELLQGDYTSETVEDWQHRSFQTKNRITRKSSAETLSYDVKD